MARGGGLDLGGLKVIRSYVRASVSCDCTATANNAISNTRSIVIVVCLAIDRNEESEVNKNCHR